MKKLKTILKSVLWVVYFIRTLRLRNEYAMSELKGCRCTGSVDTSLDETTFYFDPTQKPKRGYLTFKEYMKNEALITQLVLDVANSFIVLTQWLIVTLLLKQDTSIAVIVSLLYLLVAIIQTIYKK